ncbi:formylglycine-generating enzyme family protein [Novipirellula sp. SH528]|uniref:formylglycine-generating enzyme family protein n=1 Tax=Novipirellula sp. SH528 TaxID=3454466 RepID=UPI003F9F930C
MMLKSNILILLVCFAAPLLAGEAGTSSVVAEKPETGNFVKTDSGYMVPYTASIPGTNVTFEMVPVPGSPSGQISPFWIGMHEVTLGEYREYASLYGALKERESNQREQSFEENRVDAVSAPTPVYDPRGRFAGVESLDYPAYSMTLFAAQQYTKWLSLISKRPYRLPTEAEWERACSSGGGGYFSTEEQLRKVAVFGLETDSIAPVGTRLPNALGIHDMYGNVSEWVITRFPDSSADTNQTIARGELVQCLPVWISKGGNFASTLEDCSLQRRFVVTSEEWDSDADFPRSTTWLGSESDRVKIGFRVVRELGELDKTAMAKYWDTETRSYRQLIDTKLKHGRGAEGIVTPETHQLMQSNKQLPIWIYDPD